MSHEWVGLGNAKNGSNVQRFSTGAAVVPSCGPRSQDPAESRAGPRVYAIAGKILVVTGRLRGRLPRHVRRCQIRG